MIVSKLSNSMDINENLKMIQEELVPRFKALMERKKRLRTSVKESNTPVKNVIESNVEAPVKIKSDIELDLFKPDIICFASSTGGPDMLIKLFSGLKKLKVPVVMVQHMPPVFTTQLAKTLDKLSPNTVVEAKIGDELKPGHCYLAPGDYHMRIKRSQAGKYVVALDQSEKVCFVRPAADVLFESVAKNFEGKISGFVFTGMGNDGANGCKSIKQKSGAVLIQDEESCVVFGMPRAVYENGCFDGIFNPQELIEKINNMAGM